MANKSRPIDKERGRRLKAEIKAAGMKVSDFADKVYMDEGSIRNILCGTRNLSDKLAQDAAQILGIRSSYLMNYDDYRTDDHLIVQLQNIMQEVDNDNSLLLKGLLAFAELAEYTIRYNKPKSTSLEDFFQNMRGMWTISHYDSAITISLEEMNRLENTVYDFVKFQFEHLFEEKGAKNG